MSDMHIVRCTSCDGYGWVTDDFTGENEDCDWCGGTGYVYRDSAGIDHAIPEADYGTVSAVLEKLETQRMREIGYTGQARHPDEQPIRKQSPEQSDET